MIIIAHRGASGYAPENTCIAFKKAVSLKADFIQLDVRKCLTGDIVVINDAKVDRMTNGRGYVKYKTLSELKILNVDNGEKIPTLEEALDCIGKSTKVIITIKEGAAIDLTIRILVDYIINKGWKPENIIVSSTKFFKLQRMKERYSFLVIAPVVVFFPKLFTRALLSSMHPFSLLVDKKFINKGFVDFAHQHKVKAYVWTVNDRQTIEHMKDLGVDGIITDYPDKTRALAK